ncbi:MAG: hypothetical protein EPN88_02030 [Bacteroidetes bacterium]|nr:MAG: hypothetical protein EPN88_02030 [Bacteroidota bacterium]
MPADMEWGKKKLILITIIEVLERKQRLYYKDLYKLCDIGITKVEIKEVIKELLTESLLIRGGKHGT